MNTEELYLELGKVQTRLEILNAEANGLMTKKNELLHKILVEVAPTPVVSQPPVPTV